MKKRWSPTFLMFILLASCAPNQTDQDTKIIVVQGEDLTIPKLQACGADFEKPELVSPNNEIVDTSTPTTFMWTMDCIPDFAQIIIKRDSDPSVTLWEPTVTDLDGEYTLQLPQIPAVPYSWTLLVRNKDHEEKISDIAVFTTGPLCNAEQLVPPTLVSPADGTVDTGKGWGNMTEVNAVIKYPAGECTPRYFEIEYSTNTSFIEDKNLNPGGPKHGELVGEWLFYNDDSSGTQNCNLYYWRARAATDDGFGEWSETFNFYLDIYGNCFHFTEFKALQNANCRSDPWAGENHVGIIWEGDTAELIGLNKDASWGMFKLKNELECWVNMALVEPDPPDAVFFSGYYPVIEHAEPPEDLPAPAPVEGSSSEEPLVGCMAPSGRSGTLTCQIPCPDPDYAARVCP